MPPTEEIREELASESSTPAVDIQGLVQDNQWDTLGARLLETPDEARRLVDPSIGWTLLHFLCSIGSSPLGLVDQVAKLYPEAVTRPDKRYGDTPLHMAARNSLTSAHKVKSLLACIEGQNEAILIRNTFGGTALHSAANHNAVCSVLQALVEANPRILNVRTHDGIHAMSALYSAYIQTIPGYMAVAKIVAGEEVTSRHFERFWSKVVFLATAYLPGAAHERMVLHGLLHCQILMNFYKLALMWDPTLAGVASLAGNLPLHVLVERRPFRLKEREAIEATIKAHAEAASIRNDEGDLPIFLAIRNKMPFSNGMDVILEAHRSSVTCRDPQTGLLPFQMAAAVGGNVAVDNTFHLLLTQPDLLSAV
jgi:ankyrin repeat protein